MQAVLIAAAAVVTYVPAMSGKFIWDDRQFIVDHPDVAQADGIWHIWLAPSEGHYRPLTNTLFWVQRRIWGENPRGYHLATIALHAIGCLLVWRLAERLKLPGGFLAGLLFAVHPVNVASVAWAVEQKNTLSLIFYLLALSAFVRFIDTRARRPWAQSLAFYVLALLAKTSVVMLPPVLLLVWWWKERRVGWAALRATL
ncbi:MAG: glycosyltransferase family 39 protein, partial [Planctomycetales bacterium]|nr:glycosyltransferase family 39 protein [Planctomycetales bacterium]